MSFLETVTTGKNPRPRKCMLYGVHGIGKSTFANVPGSVFLNLEDGLADLDCTGGNHVLRTLDDIVEAIQDLYNGDHDYKLVAVDTLDWLERLIWAKIAEQKNVSTIDDVDEWQGGYKLAAAEMVTILEGLDMLVRERDMMVVLLAHSKVEKFTDPENPSYSVYSPALHKLASAVVQEWCDEVLFANFKTYTSKEKEGFGRERTVAVGAGKRIVYTEKRPTHSAKNRLGMDTEIELDFSEYAKYFTN